MWTFSTHNKGLRDVDNMRVWNVWAGNRLIISDITKQQAEHICKMHNEEATDSISKQEFRDKLPADMKDGGIFAYRSEKKV